MAKRLTDQRDELLRDIERDLRYTNDAITVGNTKEARRFVRTLSFDVGDLAVVLSKIEKKEAKA